MENKLSLETITQGLLAIERIKSLVSGDIREGQNSSVKADRVAVVHETMSAIAEFFPAARNGSMGSALKVCHDSCSTYREMKQHLRNIQGQRLDVGQLVKAFKVMKPVLKHSDRVYFDKIIRILDIINS